MLKISLTHYREMQSKHCVVFPPVYFRLSRCICVVSAGAFLLCLVTGYNRQHTVDSLCLANIGLLSPNQLNWTGIPPTPFIVYAVKIHQ